MDPSDAVVGRYAAGDLQAQDAAQAIEALLDHYEQSLYTFLVILLADRDSARDCIQDTFLRAYEHLNRGRPVTAAWLYTVARNRAIDEMRRRTREQHSDTLALCQARENAAYDGSGDAVQRALLKLSPGDREILYLAEVDDFSSKEIGSMLGIRPGTVRMRLMRAHIRFRQVFGRDA